MRRWPAVLLLMGLTGCVSQPGPDYAEADGPYAYDRGAYYADPRPVDVTVEQRGYYDPPYYYSPFYPSYYYGYYGGYRRFHGRPDGDGHHDDFDGANRERTRVDRSPEPPRVDRGDSDHSRAVPNRPSEFRSHDAPSRSSGSSARSGGPHGGHR